MSAALAAGCASVLSVLAADRVCTPTRPTTPEAAAAPRLKLGSAASFCCSRSPPCCSSDDRLPPPPRQTLKSKTRAEAQDGHTGFGGAMPDCKNFAKKN